MILYDSIQALMTQVTLHHHSGIRSLVNDWDLLTLTEAATLLKVSVVTLRRWIKQGRLPAYHVGPRKVRIRRSDLAHAFTPTSQEEVSAVPESITVRPLTDAEVAAQRQAIEESQAFIERLRAKRGGKPLDSSAPLIRRAREERSKQLL
jgi:excisionase family DNA binding protein